MAKSTRRKGNICELCCEIVSVSSTKQLKADKHLWSYLYHQNVKEALLPSTSAFNTDQSEEYSRIPKLTFSLTLGTAVTKNNAKTQIKICDECTMELGKLEKLHQQLESVKSLINCQINKINDKRKEQEAIQLNQLTSKKEKESFTSIPPPAGINLTGCSFGKENISQTLNFLGTICDGIPTIPLNLAQESQTSESLNPKSKIKIESQNEETDLVGNVKIIGLEDNLSFRDHMLMEELDDLNFEIGEEFVSIMKVEDAVIEDVEDHLPDKDPLEIPDQQNIRKKYEKRPIYVGNGPKCLPCELCKKMVHRWNWQIHQKWHAKEKQFKCELCNEGFTVKTSLLRHKRWDQKELWKHECDKCGKKYLHKYQLVRHEKICVG